MTAAIIAGFVSLVLTVWNFFSGRKSQKQIEILKNELAQKKSENDARREYEFEARKRLYEEYEPLLFQLIEASENAFSRIRSLARTSRNGSLGDDGWLGHFGYYSRSTVYNLFVPLAIFQIMKRKLTLVDLNVDKSIASLYRLVKLAYRTFMDDYKFAACIPVIEYDGDHKDELVLRKTNSSKYWKQGLPMGILDKTAAFLIDSADGKERIISYGEFERKIAAMTEEKKHDDLYYTKELFYRFHPQKRPVLWRLLVSQALVYNALLNLRGKVNSKIEDKDIVFALNPEDFEKFSNDFNWQTGYSNFAEEYKAALSYVENYYRGEGIK